ncbi:efflux transporter periplasmic adaptor subunit [Bordetella genomosp. 5]|uniref:Efflux transporter periplasmic adaptor subunit n=2 Tax=Bordetella genomosp. 5 TaxID=1395608 RepID=A0A261TXE4_9BORD|nr:efflux transporter periplasmic adaptor subunit [Bordetella genomosp. 5]
MILAGCEKSDPIVLTPVVEVGVMDVATAPVPVHSSLSGRTSPFLVAQVRARVDGIVLRREFVEGSEVKSGQLLYKIDPAPYVAALNSAKASLARAQANLVALNEKARRLRNLVGSNAVSRQSYDDAVAARGQAAADVAAAKAEVDLAEINLGYTDVRSPIDGRIGMSEVTAGAYVRSNDATLMATVQQLQPMYVDLTQSTAERLQMNVDRDAGLIRSKNGHSAAVRLTLENGQAFQELGELEVSDFTVDQSTGSVTVRAVFANESRTLLPGMFVRAQVLEGINESAMLIPQTAITHDQAGRPIALVVGQDERVSQAILTTAGTHGGSWIVTSGVKPGDRVVVQGISKVRPGEKVVTVPAQSNDRTPVPSVAGNERPTTNSRS